MRTRSLKKLSEIIESYILIADTKRVEQVKDGLRHHRRTAEVVLDILGSVMLLEVGIAPLPRCRLARAAGAPFSLHMVPHPPHTRTPRK